MTPHVEHSKTVARLYCLGDPVRGLTNVDVWNEVCDPDIMLVETPGFPRIRGLENFKKIAADVRSTFSDFNMTLDEIIAEPDSVVVRWSATVTYNSPVTLFGLKVPADLPIDRKGISILRLRRGKVAEETTYEDRLGVAQQLDDLP